MLFDKPSLTPICIPDRMAENMKEEQEVEKTNIKDEIFSLQEEILPSSTVEDTVLYILYMYRKKSFPPLL